MALLHRIAAETTTRVYKMRETAERGQGTIEYVGIAVLIGIIVLALINADFQSKLVDGVNKAIKKITDKN